MVDVRRFVESLGLQPTLSLELPQAESDEGHEMLQAMAEEEGKGSGREGGRSRTSLSSSWSLSTATIPSKGEARLLPPTAFEVNAGTTIVLGSQEYVVGRKLGGGAFGVVHEARLVEHQRPTEDDVGGVDMDTPHREPRTDPGCTLAVKLAGFIGAEGYLNVDLKLAAMAVEAAAAAEARRLTHEEVMKWEGKVFLPVLHSVGEVAFVGGVSVSSVAAI
eukprot:4799382-Amphidinium_carterae.1